jgi:hypothetical protein
MPSSRASGRRKWPWLLLGAVLVAAYSLGRYGDVAGDFYFLDDFWLLATATAIKSETAGGLFAAFRPTHVGFLLYRPLTQTGYFWLLVELFGLDSGAAHAFQLGLFTVNAVLALLIAHRQLGSVAAAVCTALLYVAAPGHGAAVYWLAACSVTGSATALFALVWWWGRSEGRARVIGCTLLQVTALLCGEYGVAGPGLILAAGAFGATREPWQRVVRDGAVPAAIVLLYGLAKLAYLASHEPASVGYGLTASPAVVLSSFGHYATATLNLLVWTVRPEQYVAVAIAVAALTVTSIALALFGFAAWRPVALGTTMFVAGIMPVVALAAHYYDFFIGVAALGAALTWVALARLLAGGRTGLAVVLVLVVLGGDARTADEAMRRNQTAVLVRNTARNGEATLVRLDQLARTQHPPAFLLPSTPLNVSAFVRGKAQELFFRPPLEIRMYAMGAEPKPRPGEIVVPTVPVLAPEEAAAAAAFHRAPRFDWLRAALLRAHTAYAAAERVLQ